LIEALYWQNIWGNEEIVCVVFDVFNLQNPLALSDSVGIVSKGSLTIKWEYWKCKNIIEIDYPLEKRLTTLRYITPSLFLASADTQGERGLVGKLVDLVKQFF